MFILTESAALRKVVLRWRLLFGDVIERATHLNNRLANASSPLHNNQKLKYTSGMAQLSLNILRTYMECSLLLRGSRNRT